MNAASEASVAVSSVVLVNRPHTVQTETTHEQLAAIRTDYSSSSSAVP